MPTGRSTRPGHAVDQAQVLGAGGAVTTPYRPFKPTLPTLEYSTIDKQYELRSATPRVGLIKEQARHEEQPAFEAGHDQALTLAWQHDT